MPLVATHDLKKTYRQGEVEVHALRGVNLTLDEGDFTAVVGPSGSGKTTLLNLIGGLDRPSAGRVAIDGQELTELSEAALSDYRLHHVGFIFQAYNLLPVLTARENVEFVMVLQGRRPAEFRRRSLDYLARVGLSELANRRPKALSGGQQQRVAVARALAAGPRLVLADEPTANLDSENALDLLALMRDLNRKERMTFLFSTHDERVMERATRVIVLRDGNISEIQEQSTGS